MATQETKDGLGYIIQAINNIIEPKVETLRYDKTYRAKITEIIEPGIYKVQLNGIEYELSYHGVLNVGDIVKVKAPLGNFSDIYIEAIPDTSGESDPVDYNDLLNKPILDTSNTNSQETQSNEIIRDTIKLHKISKTGNYNDLIGKPELNFIPTSEKGIAGGVAALDANSKLSPDNLPIATTDKLGAIKVGANLLISEDGRLNAVGDGGVVSDTLPIGAIFEWGSNYIPTNWLLCNGQEVSRTEYPELFAIIGTAYGSGDGSTTFNLPDKKSRFSVGKDDDNVDFNTLGKTGGGTGQSKIKVSPIDYGFTSTAPFYSGQALMSNTKNTTNTEESLDENGISLNPPHIVVNYIIKAKQTQAVVATVEDTLTSTSVLNALSANQGRVLNGKIEANTTLINNLKSDVTGLTAEISVIRGDYIPKSQKGGVNGVAPLDAGKIVPKANLPVDIVYDSNYKHINVVDNLTSTSKTDALSANQGSVLSGRIDANDTMITTLQEDIIGIEDKMITKIQKNGVSLPVTNKTVNITVPTKTSEITNDSGFLTSVPIASGTVLGGVKVGKNLQITTDGVLSVSAGIGGTLNYNDLLNKPILNTNNTLAQTINASETIKDTINLHKVSKTGNYNDLLNRAVINTNNSTAQSVSASETVTGTIKLHKISKTGSYGDLLNKAIINTDNSTALDVNKSETIDGTINLHKVSKTGNYDDLLNKASINTDNSTSLAPSTNEAVTGIINLHQISKTGNYNDLLNRAILNTNHSTAQTVSSTETIASTINLHKISKTGNYNDLLNKPSLDFIPTSQKNVADGVAPLDADKKVPSANLPIATTENLGAIKIGANLDVAADGTVSVSSGIGGSINYDDVQSKPSLNTNNSTAQTVSSGETITGTIKLHKISKTGNYNDLLNRAVINTNHTTAQTVSSSETITGIINFHKIAKTGKYNDLLNKPALDFIPTSEKGAASGVAALDENSKLSSDNLPIASSAALGGIKTGSGLLVTTDGTVSVDASSGSIGAPIGSIFAFAGKTAPDGYLICNGSRYSSIRYPGLFAVIGYTYGLIKTDDGETYPLLPNLEGRVAIGLKTTDTDFDTLGANGGEKEHTLTIGEMPSHKHETRLVGADSGSFSGSQAVYDRASTSTTKTTTYTGGSDPHNNLQPYIVLNYIIRAK
mgnify:CR=1 FL=1